MINETISRYRIIEQLAKGAVGVVYKAIDTALGRHVAIKVLSSARRDDRDCFLREARAIAVLSHPCIATVFDYGETPEGQPYIVMELVKGHPLSEKLQEGPLPLPEAVRIVSTIAETLSEAHGRGVIHRDIKPSNVLLTDRGEARVSDFGLVKQMPYYLGLPGKKNQEATIPTIICSDGVIFVSDYLSPEQVSGGKIDARTDLFALGVVMYECLTGRPPFSGVSLNEVHAQVCNFTPPLPSQTNAQVPPILDRTTMKAIEKRVEDRFQSANELIEELRGLQPKFFENAPHRGAAPSVPKKSSLNLRDLASQLNAVEQSVNAAVEAMLALQPKLPDEKPARREVPQSKPTASSSCLRDLESEFDDLLAKMQTPKSKRAMRVAFQASPAQLGRAAVRHARKQR